jgi:NAD(P)-dependent dehydrogenase (short-subunit alcohol dehydrogenase family)
VQLDLADRDSIPGVLKHLDELTKGDDIEVVLFNAARIKQYPILDVNVDEIHEDFKIQTLALYLVAQHYIPKLQSVAKSGSSLKPAFLVTNSHLPWDPAPTFLSLSLNKASQRNMTWSFRRAFADSGVHIGLISVQGAVSPENKVLNPITIAERAYGFWEAGDQGALEVEIKEG